MWTDTLPLEHLSPGQVDNWRELAAHALTPNPFFHPAFVLPAARALDARGVALLVAQEGGEWRAVLPVRRSRAWRRVPGRCLAVWQHRYCFLGNPLVRPDTAEPALHALLSQALRLDPCVGLDTIVADGPLAEALSAAADGWAEIVVTNQSARALLTPETTDPARTLSSHHRRELRRKRRRLEETMGPLTLTDRAADGSAWEEFLALERQSWKGAAGTALASRPTHGDFFREMCAGFAASGQLELWALAGERGTAAMMCNLQSGEGVFGFKVASSDPNAKLSPGIHLQLDYMARFAGGPFAYTDSCARPGDETLERLWSARRRLQTVAVVSRRLVSSFSRTKWRAVSAADPLREQIAARRHEAAMRRWREAGRTAA